MSGQKPIPIGEKLPKRNKAVIVVSEDSRSVGYLDSEGEWRTWQTHDKLENVIAWFHVSDDWWGSNLK